MPIKDCPFCAEPIQDKAKKCKHCGEFLDESLRKEKESEAKPQSPPTPIEGVGMGLDEFRNKHLGGPPDVDKNPNNKEQIQAAKPLIGCFSLIVIFFLYVFVISPLIPTSVVCDGCGNKINEGGRNYNSSGRYSTVKHGADDYYDYYCTYNCRWK